MALQKFNEICEIAKVSTGSHQKCLKQMTDFYDTCEEDEYFQAYIKSLQFVFYYDLHKKYPELDRIFEFLVKLAIAMHQKTSEGEEDFEYDTFLIKVLEWVLQLHDNIEMKYRYASCKFIASILDSIDDNVDLNENIYDMIEEAMLKRMKDRKASIRMMAVKAVHRLQVPFNSYCPVIQALIQSMLDSSPMVRKEVIQKVAPCSISISKIVFHVMDTDYKVRNAVFWKCSLMRPTILKIVDRQKILLNGFQEQNLYAKKAFLEVTLPKWLTAYEGNFLDFLAAIQLDADENDIEISSELSHDLMQSFFRAYPLQDIIGCLPIDENRLLPIEKIANDKISYWSILHSYLRKSDNELLDQIVPELSFFCNYIERVIKEKFKENFDHWEVLEYEFVLIKLFEMVASFDLSDEAGRKVLHLLITNTLKTRKLNVKIIEKMLEILDTLSINTDILISEICNIIYSIKEPMIDVQPSADEVRQHNFKLAELSLKINILTDEIDVAIRDRELMLAAEKEEELKALVELKARFVTNGPTTSRVKQVLTGLETQLRCLDITIAALSLASITRLGDTLRNLKTELIDMVKGSDSVEIYFKLLKLLTLSSLIDRTSALEHTKLIFTPIYTYRTTPEGANTQVVAYSIKAIGDLLCVFGPKLFVDLQSTQNATQNKKRRLYQVQDSTDAFVDNDLCFEGVIDLFLYLLDDECFDVREGAGAALGNLLYIGILKSPSVISRIFLKWCNPITANLHPKVHQLIGMALDNFSQNGGADVIKMATIPTLKVFYNAPKTSPLADVNLNDVVEILCVLTATNKKSIDDVHKSLAFNLCTEISNNPNDKFMVILIKMLLLLNVPFDDKSSVIELIAFVDKILENIDDKLTRQKLQKYKAVLLQVLSVINLNDNNLEIEADSVQIAENHIESDEINENNKRTKQLIDGINKKSKIDLVTTNNGQRITSKNQNGTHVEEENSVFNDSEVSREKVTPDTSKIIELSLSADNDEYLNINLEKVDQAEENNGKRISSKNQNGIRAEEKNAVFNDSEVSREKATPDTSKIIELSLSANNDEHLNVNLEKVDQAEENKNSEVTIKKKKRSKLSKITGTNKNENLLEKVNQTEKNKENSVSDDFISEIPSIKKRCLSKIVEVTSNNCKGKSSNKNRKHMEKVDDAERNEENSVFEESVLKKKNKSSKRKSKLLNNDRKHLEDVGQEEENAAFNESISEVLKQKKNLSILEKSASKSKDKHSLKNGNDLEENLIFNEPEVIRKKKNKKNLIVLSSASKSKGKQLNKSEVEESSSKTSEIELLNCQSKTKNAILNLKKNRKKYNSVSSIDTTNDRMTKNDDAAVQAQDNESTSEMSIKKKKKKIELYKEDTRQSKSNKINDNSTGSKKKISITSNILFTKENNSTNIKIRPERLNTNSLINSLKNTSTDIHTPARAVVRPKGTISNIMRRSERLSGSSLNESPKNTSKVNETASKRFSAHSKNKEKNSQKIISVRLEKVSLNKCAEKTVGTPILNKSSRTPTGVVGISKGSMHSKSREVLPCKTRSVRLSRPSSNEFTEKVVSLNESAKKVTGTPVLNKSSNTPRLKGLMLSKSREERSYRMSPDKWNKTSINESHKAVDIQTRGASHSKRKLSDQEQNNPSKKSKIDENKVKNTENKDKKKLKKILVDDRANSMNEMRSSTRKRNKKRRNSSRNK